MIPAVLLIILGSLVPSGNANTKTKSLCPQEFLNSAGNFVVETNTTCYRFVPNEKGSFWNARKKCMSSGGNLASITTRMENYLITTKLQKVQVQNKFWIGLSNPKSSNGRELKWDDGTPVSFTFWANSQDLKGTSDFHCALLDASNMGRWWFVTSCWCSGDQCPGFICKYTAKTRSTTSARITTDAPTTKKAHAPTAMATDASPTVTSTARPATTSNHLTAMATDASSTVTSTARPAVTSDATSDSVRTTKVPLAVTTDTTPGLTTDTTPPVSTDTTPAPTTTVAFEPDREIIIDCVFNCPDLDCGMEGFKMMDDGCQLCECNE